MLACGRRFGKDVLGHELAIDTLIELGAPAAWMAPTYRMMLDTFKDMQALLQPITSRVQVADRRIETITGGVLDFWSLDGETVRGRKYKRVILNEAAMVPDLARKWNEAIRPTLADYEGDAFFLSTPRGRNGFWQMYRQGVDGANGWRSWHFPTSENPHINRAEIEAMREGMPERSYLQEIEAQFVEDSGLVFRRVRECATATRQDGPIDGHQYVMGVDLARRVDYTVLTVIDVSLSPPALVYIDRFNQIDWDFQVQRIKALAQRFGVSTVLVDQTGVGDPVLGQLQRELSS